MGIFKDIVNRISKGRSGRMAGRFRTRSTVLEGFDSYLYNVPELAEYDDPYTRPAGKLYSPYDEYRFQRYKFHKALFAGDQYNAFRYVQYLYKSGMLDDDRKVGDIFGRYGLDVVFVTDNILEICTEAFGDLIAGSLRSIAPINNDEKVAAAIKRISRNSNLKQLLRLSAITGHYKGDVVWQVCGSKEDGVRIRQRRVNQWAPVLDARDPTGFSEHDFISEITLGKRRYAAVERHQPGVIYLEVKEMDGTNIKGEAGPEVYEEIWGSQLPMIEYPGLGWMVRHLPNRLDDDDNPFGESSYTRSVQAMMDELNHRLTQLANELDKHGRLGAQGPPLGGEEVENPENDVEPNRGPGAKYIELMPDDQRASYIDYPTGHLAVITEQIAYSCEEICRLLRISPRLMGYKKGAAEEAFDTLRLACIQTILRNQSYVADLDTMIKWAYETAFKLEKSLGIPDAISNTDAVELKTDWSDGFPIDEEKRARIHQIRTGGKATETVEDAIRDMDGEENAAEHAQAVRTEDGMALNSVPGMQPRPFSFNLTGNPPEINPGQTEPGQNPGEK